MASNISSAVDQVVNIFSSGGYNSLRCDSSFPRFCFDIIASKLSKILITKVVSNIDAIPEKSLTELKIITHFFDEAVPLIIGQTSRRKKLEKNTAYHRQEIVALNIESLSNLIVNNVNPYFLAKRGSYISKIDGHKMRDSRENLLISRKELSKMLNVSLKTISSYESGNMNSNIEHIQKLEEILKVEIKIPINILDQKHMEIPKEEFIKKPKKANIDERLAGEIYDLFEELDIIQFWTSKSPFDVLFSLPRNDEKQLINKNSMIGAVFSSIDYREEKRLKILSSLLRLVGIQGSVIVEDHIDAKKCKIAGVPVIEKNDLKTIKDPKEFKKLVHKSL